MKYERVIFVFGSNLAGIHGAGAAKFAHEEHGAEWGVGEGLTGDSYALPTKDENIKTLPWPEVEENINEFLDHAETFPENLYILTPVGCGLAGYNKRGLWLVLKHRVGVPENVVLSHSWFWDH